MTDQPGRRPSVLHAVRLLGFGDAAAIASRAGVSRTAARDDLRDAELSGWVQHTSFADLEGWSLTAAGKAENERRLAVERERADPDRTVAAAYREFLPLNASLLRAVTAWQLAPTESDMFAPNSHVDTTRDACILAELEALAEDLTPLIRRLSRVLPRFAGYDLRFEAALARAHDGEHDWVDRTDRDSCHRVWFQLHEDLIATLGIDRHAEHQAGQE